MEHVAGEKLIVNFFVYRSFQNKLDVTVHGINGNFHTPEAIAEFITNPNDHDLSGIEKELNARFSEVEFDQFYWVYATLVFFDCEYGDYGETIGNPYYAIGEVLEVAVEDVEFEDTESTESA